MARAAAALFLPAVPPWIFNNLIHNNSAGTDSLAYGLVGGMILGMHAGDAYVISNTITENIVHARTGSTDGTGGGVLVETDEDAWAGSNVHLYNNIVFQNDCAPTQGSDDISNDIAGSGPYAGTLVISHSDYGELGSNTGLVTPQLTDNIHAAPLFSRQPETLYHLTSRSPCVDSGTNSAPYLPASDLAGQDRVQGGNNDGTAITNMGCYEDVLPVSFPWPMYLPAMQP